MCVGGGHFGGKVASGSSVPARQAVRIHSSTAGSWEGRWGWRPSRKKKEGLGKAVGCGRWGLEGADF